MLCPVLAELSAVFADAYNAIGRQVDEEMRVLLSNLRDMMEAERAAKSSKKGKKKGGKKGGKKGKKGKKEGGGKRKGGKKGKDPTVCGVA